MLMTTTYLIENQTVTEYKGIVFGEAITGIQFFKDLGASFRNVFGGRSQSYEEELFKARREALMALEARAREMRADAVIGLSFDYQMLGSENNILMVTCNGTAVTLQ